MITAWRIVKGEYVEEAFEGKSASFAGGRWNSRGVAVVYTSSTASLAAMELLVHLQRDRDLSEFVMFACTFDETTVEDIDRDKLPHGWNGYPAPDALAEIGNIWIVAATSAVLRVPSVIIDSEFNYLLNPAHREFRKIQIADPVPFSLDMRLLGIHRPKTR